MLCPLNKKIRTRLKCTVYCTVPRYRKNSCVINVFDVSGIECKIVYIVIITLKSLGPDTVPAATV